MLKTWQALEDLYNEGLVKSIGVCNFEKSQLEFLLAHCKISPMINQIEHTPLMRDETLISFCKENNIQIMAWGPLLRGNMEDSKNYHHGFKISKKPCSVINSLEPSTRNYPYSKI